MTEHPALSEGALTPPSEFGVARVLKKNRHGFISCVWGGKKDGSYAPGIRHGINR